MVARRALRDAKPVGDRGCVQFHGSIDANGYARFKYLGRLYAPHRAVLEYLIDRPLERNEDARQTCGLRSCIAPEHLRLSSRRSTVLDAIEEGRITPPTSKPQAVAESNRRRSRQAVEEALARLEALRLRLAQELEEARAGQKPGAGPRPRTRKKR